MEEKKIKFTADGSELDNFLKKTKEQLNELNSGNAKKPSGGASPIIDELKEQVRLTKELIAERERLAKLINEAEVKQPPARGASKQPPARRERDSSPMHSLLQQIVEAGNSGNSEIIEKISHDLAPKPVSSGEGVPVSEYSASQPTQEQKVDAPKKPDEIILENLSPRDRQAASDLGWDDPKPAPSAQDATKEEKTDAPKQEEIPVAIAEPPVKDTRSNWEKALESAEAKGDTVSADIIKRRIEKEKNQVQFQEKKQSAADPTREKKTNESKKEGGAADPTRIEGSAQDATKEEKTDDSKSNDPKRTLSDAERELEKINATLQKQIEKEKEINRLLDLRIQNAHSEAKTEEGTDYKAFEKETNALAEKAAKELKELEIQRALNEQNKADLEKEIEERKNNGEKEEEEEEKKTGKAGKGESVLNSILLSKMIKDIGNTLKQIPNAETGLDLIPGAAGVSGMAAGGFLGSGTDAFLNLISFGIIKTSAGAIGAEIGKSVGEGLGQSWVRHINELSKFQQSAFGYNAATGSRAGIGGSYAHLGMDRASVYDLRKQYELSAGRKVDIDELKIGASLGISKGIDQSIINSLFGLNRMGLGAANASANEKEFNAKRGGAGNANIIAALEKEGIGRRDLPQTLQTLVNLVTEIASDTGNSANINEGIRRILEHNSINGGDSPWAARDQRSAQLISTSRQRLTNPDSMFMNALSTMVLNEQNPKANPWEIHKLRQKGGLEYEKGMLDWFRATPMEDWAQNFLYSGMAGTDVANADEMKLRSPRFGTKKGDENLIPDVNSRKEEREAARYITETQRDSARIRDAFVNSFEDGIKTIADSFTNRMLEAIEDLKKAMIGKALTQPQSGGGDGTNNPGRTNNPQLQAWIDRDKRISDIRADKIVQKYGYNKYRMDSVSHELENIHGARSSSSHPPNQDVIDAYQKKLNSQLEALELEQERLDPFLYHRNTLFTEPDLLEKAKQEFPVTEDDIENYQLPN